MSKRTAEASDPVALKNRSRENDEPRPELDPEMGEMEDFSGDESGDEGSIIVAGDTDEEDEGEQGAHGDAMDIDEKEQVRESLPQGRQRRENMEFDPSTYDMLHEFRTPWPCLSFDIMKDDLGDERRSFPHTVYMVAGTQAEKAVDNKMIVTKVSSLHKIKNGEFLIPL